MNDMPTQCLSSFPANPTNAVEAVDTVLRYAASLGASDAHFDPRPQDLWIRLRIDGELEPVGTLPRRLHEEIIARLKILSGVRTDLHAVPQDGRFRITLNNVDYNARVSFMPTYRGENAVIRLLSVEPAAQDTFAALGFTPEHVLMISRALAAKNGLILVTGPTGSGKTTTLRVCLGLKAAEPLSIMTLEDPVEYEVPGVRHVHIRHAQGVTFGAGLRAALRQDPDVIMVGEIRDGETAHTAVHTALTGHLVLSTLHTTSALESILRLIDMGVEPYLIAATLHLVISQRLVRVTCADCAGQNEFCVSCRGSGFRGRYVMAEVLSIDDGLRQLISSRASLQTMREYVLSSGFRTISEDAGEKVDWGVTSRAEVSKVLAA